MRFLSIFPLAALLIIILLIVLKVISLKTKGISFRSQKSKTSGINLLLYPIFIMLLLLWLAALISQTFNLNLFFNSTLILKPLVASQSLKTAGALVVLISVLLMGITLVHFKTSLRFGLNKNNQGQFITKGIFSLSRNPFFLSLNLYFIGQAMVFPGILFITMALLAVTGIHFFILKEEKFLVNHHQHLYTHYREKVRRYL